MIVGGGIAGLLAAHALADRFERVTLLEQFRYPPTADSVEPVARRGVPQSRCIHLLMAAGVSAFDVLMPGWSEELVARGAGPFDACADTALRLPPGWLPRVPSGITAYACSRALLEKVLRRSLVGKSSVSVREGQKVVGLLSDPRSESVTGILTTQEHAAGETPHLADLVVDASGTGSALPRWIARLPNGISSQLQKSVVKSGMQYVSRWFNIKPEDAPDWRCLSIAPSARTAFRSAMILRAEENRWGVVLLARDGERLPSNDTSFKQFIASLGDRELQRTFDYAKPSSTILHYGPTSNCMIHLELVTKWPQGLVSIGDSVCTLDPYFGLGMTLAARGAALLRACLDQKDGASISSMGFQKELANLNAGAWRLATGREPNGQTPALDKTHLRHLSEAATLSPAVAHTLLAMQHLLRPVETLGKVAAL